MSVYQEMATAMPHDLINAKPVMAAIREFFGSSQLSQFMDQTNPLSEITHKRRLSALGPGGLSRERAGFEVRDVHPTHYGRICPIETPEGPNIGLISSLSCYARINEFGFIESPYRKVKDGRVIDYVHRHQRRRHPKYKVGDIVEADEHGVDDDGRSKKKGVEFEPVLLLPVGVGRGPVHHRAGERAGRRRTASSRSDRVNARQAGNFILSPRDKVAVHRRLAEAARLGRRLAHPVPRERRREPRADGIEHAAPGGAAAPRAGAVSSAPAWSTSPRATRARCIVARRSGTVDYVDSQRIVVRVEGETEATSREMGADIYPMTKFKRSNQNTCINQKPIVRVGPEGAQGAGAGRRPVHGARRARARPQRAGRVHAVARLQLRGRDPRLRADGEGRLLHVHPHRGVRDRGARHQARARGNHARHPERRRRATCATSTRAASSASAPTVKPGDILVGKVTPKGETQLTPEEKLLRAIFGEKAGDVRDASLICPPGIEGIIVGVKIFSRKGIEKDDRAKAIEQEELDMMEKNLQDEIRILHDEVKKRVIVMLQGQELARRISSTSTAASGCCKKGTDAHAGRPAGAALRGDGAAEDRRPTTRGSRTTCASSRSGPSARSKSSASCSRRRRRRSAAATSCLRASSSWSRSTSR